MTPDAVDATLRELKSKYDALVVLADVLGAEMVAAEQHKLATKALETVRNSGVQISDLSAETLQVLVAMWQVLVSGNTGNTAVGDGAQAGDRQMQATVTDVESSVVVVAGGNVSIGGVQVTVESGIGGKKAKALLDHYLTVQFSKAQVLRLEKIMPRDLNQQKEPLRLGQIYVDLWTDLQIPDGMGLREYWQQGRQQDARDAGEKERKLRAVSVLEALGTHRALVLLGAPGSGKTTLGLYLTLALAEAALGQGEGVARLGQHWQAGPLFPVPVVLRQFAETVQPQRRGRASDLWAFLFAEWQRLGLDAGVGPLVQETARQAGALFILDGLDEAADGARRARVVEAVAEFMQTAGARCRYVLTSRPYAWADGLWPGEFGAAPPVYRLKLLETPQIGDFIDRWYAALPTTGWNNGDVREAARLREALKGNIERADLRPLLENPLLLTLTTSFQATTGVIPDDRVELYDEMVSLMLDRWHQASGDAAQSPLRVQGLSPRDVRKELERVAFEVHGESVGQTGAADIAAERLVTAFKPLVGGADNAEKVVQFIDERAGLLIGQGSRRGVSYYAFPHRTFQEYLAACYLKAQRDYAPRAKKLAQAAPGHWREVIRMAGRAADEAYGIDAADWLVGKDDCPVSGPVTPEHGRLAVLAAEQLLEIKLHNVQKLPEYHKVLTRVRGWVGGAVMGTALPATERAEAGRVLAALGDERPGVGVDPATGLPDIAWCVVPGGPFVMGSGEYYDEKPQHENGLLKDGYWLGQYPVTVGQFAAFVQAGGYADRRYWGEAEKAGYWKNGQFRDRNGPNTYGGAFELPNHPVVGVSWYEALAFARWLEEQYRAKGWLPAGYGVTLPSEAEWEKAARGGLKLPSEPLPVVNGAGLARGVPPVAGWQDNPNRARRYPWGDDITPEHANYKDTRIGTTSAVGAFAAKGVSPYGCVDLSGNVWEWTRSVYSAYDKTAGYDRPAERENLAAGAGGARVLRGGSWNNFVFRTRAALRFTSSIRTTTTTSSVFGSASLFLHLGSLHSEALFSDGVGVQGAGPPAPCRRPQGGGARHNPTRRIVRVFAWGDCAAAPPLATKISSKQGSM